jgi:cell division protein FtsN
MIKFIVGLVLGIAVAGGLAYYLNNTPTQFVNKVTNSNVSMSANGSAPIVLAPSTKYQVAASNAIVTSRHDSANSDTEAKNASEPSYDFYDVLQGKKTADNNPDSGSTAKVSKFYLQAGEFASQDQANDMKARLALMGIDAKIKSQQQDGKIINRIIIGPFASQADTDDTLSQLKENDISVTLVKISN